MLKKWQKKEQKDAKDFEARRTPRSGGIWFAKGDSNNEEFLIENKTSKHNSFSIKQSVWRKLEREALTSGKLPLLSIEFGDQQTELVIMSRDDFISMLYEALDK